VFRSVVSIRQEKSLIDEFIDTGKPVRYISSKRSIVAGENARLIDVLHLMFTSKFRKIPVVDGSRQIKGIITSVDMIDLLGGGDKYRLFEKNKKSMEAKADKFMTKHLRAINHKTSVKKALQIFKRDGRGLYPVVDSKKLVSVISEWDFIKRVNRPLGLKVYDIMVLKPIFAKRNYSVFEVAKMMCRGGFRRLPVVEDNILIGIATPTDILRHIHRKGIQGKFVFDSSCIEDAMNREVFTIRHDADVISAIDVMRSKNVGGLPVVDGEELAGIITERDILDVLV
jgi:CBS domain-containing protein